MTKKDAGSYEVLVQVRCPYCSRLVCEAAEGSLVRAKCPRCHGMFERAVVTLPPTRPASVMASEGDASLRRRGGISR